MLDELTVTNLALIREATIAFSPGLTVLTGETGAGKTALLSACRLLIGERATREMVRDGASELTLSGRLFVDGEDSAQAGEVDEQELVVTRRVGSDGRSRATINGVMASVGEVAERCGPLIDLCSQHEHQQLLRPANHRRLLDQWAAAEVAGSKAAYERAFDEAEAAARRLAELEEASRRSAREIEDAQFTLKRINEVDPQAGEYEELEATLARAEHGESLARAADEAYRALTGDEALAGPSGALERLNEAVSALLGGAALDGALRELAERCQSALIDVEDVAAEVRAYRDRVEFDPQALEEAAERLATLRGLLRTYGPRFEDVIAVRDAAAETVSLSVDGADRLAAAERARDEAERALEAAAGRLAAVRAAAAPRFCEAVSAPMDRLAMGGAGLECDVTDLERTAWTREGSQTVEFLFRPGPTMAARPLARIASGGELSRVMLAIKVVLGESDNVPTLIFDEVDAGVGGATAYALADVLADLARTHQVIAVTHLAQIAARADHHIRVFRSGEEGDSTALEPVSDEARVHEIARMLSGDATELSLAHARELLGVTSSDRPA